MEGAPKNTQYSQDDFLSKLGEEIKPDLESVKAELAKVQESIDATNTYISINKSSGGVEPNDYHELAQLEERKRVLLKVLEDNPE